MLHTAQRRMMARSSYACGRGLHASRVNEREQPRDYFGLPVVFFAAASTSALVIAMTRPLSFLAKLETGIEAFAFPVLTTAPFKLTDFNLPDEATILVKD